MKRQTRGNFEAWEVLQFLKGCPWKGEAPEQGWVSLVEEACHRILRLEMDMQAMAGAARSLHLGSQGILDSYHIRARPEENRS